MTDTTELEFTSGLDKLLGAKSHDEVDDLLYDALQDAPTDYADLIKHFAERQPGEYPELLAATAERVGEELDSDSARYGPTMVLCNRATRHAFEEGGISAEDAVDKVLGLAREKSDDELRELAIAIAAEEMPERSDSDSAIRPKTKLAQRKKSAKTPKRSSADQRLEYSGQDIVSRYLDETSKFPLLTKEDEVRLGKTIEKGQEAAEKLAGLQAGRGGDELTDQNSRELERVVTEGKRAKKDFINANLRLVVSIAKKYIGPKRPPLIDMIQEGNFGLMRAVEKYDWRKGFKFSTYATWWIKQSIERAIDNSDPIRIPGPQHEARRAFQAARARLASSRNEPPSKEDIAEDLGITIEQVNGILHLYNIQPSSLDEPLKPDEPNGTKQGDLIASPEDPIWSVVDRQAVVSTLGKLARVLSLRERTIIGLRFGLDLEELQVDGKYIADRPMTLKEAGEVLGITNQAVSLVEQRALAKLKRAAQDSGLEDMFS